MRPLIKIDYSIPYKFSEFEKKTLDIFRYKMKKKDYSCSAFILYLGLDKTYDGKAADRKGNAVIDKAEYKVLENSQPVLQAHTQQNSRK